MDSTLASEMLQGFQEASPIEDYVFRGVLGNGKSAAVFQASAPDGEVRAIKVYDPEMAARYGTTVQEERQRRELELVGHDCTSLVQIYRGGLLTTLGRQATFLEMEFVDGCDLRERIAPHAFDDGAIRKALRQLCVAASYLHERRLCHRDIKPDNIRSRPNGDLVLLDLGVLRPLEGSDLTDTPAGRPFVGTLRYAPPELLHGRVQEDPDGWRAVDVYQLGAVLYELIQGVRLFSHVPDNPYADLVVAVGTQSPALVRFDVGADLIRLARNSLEKDPSARLRAAPWSSVVAVANAPSPVSSPASDTAAALELRMQAAAAQYAPVADAARRAGLARERAERVATEALRVATEELRIESLGWRGGTPRAETAQEHSIVSVAVYSDLEHGFVGNTVFAVAIQRAQDPTGHVVASGLGLHTPHFFPGVEKSSVPLLTDHDLAASWELLYAEAFDATEFRRVLQDWFRSMAVVHLDAMRPLVDAELEEQRRRLEDAVGRVAGGVSVHTSSTTTAARWFTRTASAALARVRAGGGHRR